VTQKGETFASRVAASLLTTHGFPELVTSTPDDYFTLALKLATDSDLRAKTRERLDRARMVSPLFDTALFTKNLEELYRAMLQNHSMPEAQRLRVITLKGADRS
jgi:predicted O-linked N-acetylglucosamine transferase (SPINDLY family)